MTALRKLLTRPAKVELDFWFSTIAAELLSRYRLIANGIPLQLRRIEIYYRSEDHPDPFVHAFPLQREPSRWYFHRIGSGYRGGNYKGLDLTFGDGHALGGILFRTAETRDGKQIRGPSKLVDFILETCDFERVADLDAAIGNQSADGTNSLLYLQRQRRRAAIAMRRGPRVGLSMKKATLMTRHAEFVNRPYGFWFG